VRAVIGQPETRSCAEVIGSTGAVPGGALAADDALKAQELETRFRVRDLRALPLHMRKTNLVRLLARRPEGIFVSEFERGEIGPDLFRAACRMGLEGMVSKRRDRPYRAGRSPHWIKMKNRKHPAVERVKEAFA
jgi:hypothetical protein